MKTKIIIAFLALSSSLSTLEAQVNDPIVLMTVGGKPVYLEEFKEMYYDNFPKDSVKNQKSLDDYLVLFEDFRMKVNAALDARIDTTTDYKKEISDYRTKMVQPKMHDSVVEDELIKQAYDRMHWDIRASHILIRVDQYAPPADTLAAYNRIMDIRAKILGNRKKFLFFNTGHKGIPFDEAAKEYSEDKMSGAKGGDLGYFTALAMLYPFENTAYNTPVGSVSMPVRTKYGYHIVYVTDKRPDAGQILIAHIMLRTPQKLTSADSIKIVNKADSIYHLALSGQDFGKLATQFSQDQGSAKRGGQLPWFGMGKYARYPSFEDAAFGLKNVGDVAAPIRTQFGWHILKLEGRKPLQPFDSVKTSIMVRIEKDARYELCVVALENKLKTKYQFKEYPEVKNEMYGLIDSSFYKGKWSVPAGRDLSKPLFSLEGKNYTQEDFANYIAQNQAEALKQSTSRNAQVMVDMLYPMYVQKEVLQSYDDNIEREDKPLGEMLQQYREGILLFDITDKEVWSKAIKDTAGLRAYYETVKNKYLWDERCDASIYTCKDATVAKEVKEMLKKGKTDKEIQTEINGKTGDLVTITSGKYSKNDNATIDANWKKGITKEEVQNGKVVFADVKEVLPPQPKTLDEVRGIVSTDYQNYLMVQWLAYLKQKYPIWVNQKALTMVLPGK